jgi:hypothetical protein
MQYRKPNEDYFAPMSNGVWKFALLKHYYVAEYHYNLSAIKVYIYSVNGG